MPPMCRNRTTQTEARPSPREWENLRPRLTAMYQIQTLRLIRDILATELGFFASEKQFRDKFKQWGINTKNIKRQIKDRALAGIDGGVVGVSDTVVYYGEIAIPMRKLRRHQADRIRERRAMHTSVESPLLVAKQRGPDPGFGDAGNEPSPEAESPAESSSSHTLTAGGVDTPCPVEAPTDDGTVTCGGSTRHPSSEASSPGRPMGPREDPRGLRSIAKNIWDLRVFIGLSSWFFDFLRMCRDPALSPLDPEGWGDAFESQLTGYHTLFVLGKSRAAQAARDAVEGLWAALNGPENAVVRAVSRPEDINVPEFQTLHRLCDVQYPDEVKLRFSPLEIQQELEWFEIESSKMRDSLRRFESDLEETSRRRLELDARPFRRGGGSPAAFYHRLREVVLFAFPKVDIFADDGLNFGQVRAFNPGPHPGPMICFYDLEVSVSATSADATMYDEKELEEYGVVARQGWH